MQKPTLHKGAAPLGLGSGAGGSRIPAGSIGSVQPLGYSSPVKVADTLGLPESGRLTLVATGGLFLAVS